MEVDEWLLHKLNTEWFPSPQNLLIFSPPVLKVGVQDKLVQESGTLETRDDENNVDGVDLDVARKNNLDDFTDLLLK